LADLQLTSGVLNSMKIGVDFGAHKTAYSVGMVVIYTAWIALNP
jgi:hypothetical protein